MEYFVGIFTFVFLSDLVFASTSISATGGGIVKEGSKLVLKYETGNTWDMCYWFRHEADGKYEYCLFSSQADPSTARKLKCEPSTFADSMIYSGKSREECSITVPKTTDADNRTWSVRVDAQLKNVPIQVVVAKSVESVDLEVPPIKAGAPGSIKCKVAGGRPAPAIEYSFDPPRNGLHVSDKKNQVADKDGIFNTEVEIVVNPEISDNGRKVSCEAAISDGEKNPLFKPVSSGIEKLNVIFPPQELKNQTVGGKTGDNLTVSFEILANPKPSAVTWTVFVAKKILVKGEGNETKHTIKYNPMDITAGHDGKKYTAPDLADTEKDKYMATFVIRNADKADHHNLYKLVVGSSSGKQTYFFKISLDGVDGDSVDTDISTSTVGIAVGIAVAVIVVGAIIGLVIVRKANKKGGETAPLNG